MNGPTELLEGSIAVLLAITAFLVIITLCVLSGRRWWNLF